MVDTTFCQCAVTALMFFAIGSTAIDTSSNTFKDSYYRNREKIIVAERKQSLGGTLVLSPSENQLNERLMVLKRQEIDMGFLNVSTFNPAQHFFKRKPFVDASPVLKFLKRMPKGAALHLHDASLIGVDFLVKNITYMDNLYMCDNGEDVRFYFFKTQPKPDKDCDWQLLKTLRESSIDPELFDNQLSEHFTLKVDDPTETYPTINVVWDKFSQIFDKLNPILAYKPALEVYFYEALIQYRKDKVMYLEIRTLLPNMYDLDGTVYGDKEIAITYKKISDRFKKEYPDCFGVRIIYSPLRHITRERVKQCVNTALSIKKELGDFLAGFDLTGPEDCGIPLVDFEPELIKLRGKMDVFYHSGETNWFGLSSDYNLVDAALLGAKRLGHAYALLKHPVVAEMVKNNDIALEINPLSNQILMLVADIRNHPATLMLANNYPLVISSDDSGLWGSLPMSHDMYMAFIGLASRDDDLRMLKQLTINSIKYSSMPIIEKHSAMSELNKQWDNFVQSELKTNSPKVINT